jgi:hypothetical protein
MDNVQKHNTYICTTDFQLVKKFHVLVEFECLSRLSQKLTIELCSAPVQIFINIISKINFDIIYNFMPRFLSSLIHMTSQPEFYTHIYFSQICYKFSYWMYPLSESTITNMVVLQDCLHCFWQKHDRIQAIPGTVRSMQA